MPFYLAPYIGAGTIDDPFRPRGSDQLGWHAIDVRPDGGATLEGGGLNACLLYLPVHDPDPLLNQIGDAADEQLANITKARFCTALTLSTLRAMTVEQMVEEIMVAPPANGWKPVQPGMNGAKEIHLGPIDRQKLTPQSGLVLWRLLPWVAMVTGISAAALSTDPTLFLWALGLVITEGWTCADADLLNCSLTWTELQADLDLISNRAVTVTTDASSARADTDLATANHYAQAKVNLTVDEGSGGGVIARKDSTATMTFYMSDIVWSNDTSRLFKSIAGTFTAIGTPVATTLVVPTQYLVRLEVNGSTLTTKVDGVTKQTETDTAIAGNLRCGIRGQSAAGGTGRVEWDDFEAGDLVTAKVPYQPWYRTAPLVAQ